MAALAAVVVLVAFAFGYRFYARFLGERVYDDRDELVTPAHEVNDGIDFVPTQRAVLFGHHFTSTALASPMLVLLLWMIVEGALAVRRIAAAYRTRAQNSQLGV